jgi:putative membrane protein
MVVFWVAVIGLVVWAVARLAPAGSARTDGSAPRTDDSARRTIDERYARGELDEEEYRRRRDEVGR